MRSVMPKILAFAIAVCVPCTALAQGSGDEAAVNRVIDQLNQLEDVFDMPAQAELMTADRIWIGQGLGRITNQAQNMQVQQAGFDVLKGAEPEYQRFTDARDRIIRFYGNGDVAVASFYWYVTVVLPTDATAEQVQAAAVFRPMTFTLVLEKQSGTWKIVHTHWSDLGVPTGQ